MSRGYRVRWPAPVGVSRSGKATARDTLRMDIDLLPILDAAEMQVLLRAVLSQGDWSETDGALTTQVRGATVRLRDDHLEIELEGSRSVSARGASAQEASAKVDKLRTAAEERLTAQLREKMARIEAALCEQLEPAVQQVYVEALKRKAAKMGEVQSIDERRDGSAVELTIKVKV